jgi:hypothetical protein
LNGEPGFKTIGRSLITDTLDVIGENGENCENGEIGEIGEIGETKLIGDETY